MLAFAPGDDEVHEMLQAGEFLTPSPDEHAQVLALDVELRRLAAHGDLDGPLQVHQPQELDEDRLGLLEYGALLLGELLERLRRHEWRGLAGGPVGTRGTLGAVAAVAGHPGPSIALPR